MTRKEALKKIEAKALANNYNADVDGRFPSITLKDKISYINFTIGFERDSKKSDWIKGIDAGYFTITASISRMGGNPSSEELLMAAKQIQEAAEFVREMEKEDLSYIEQM